MVIRHPVKRRRSSANRPPPQGNRNLLLAALPGSDCSRIARSLDTVPLKLRSLLHRAGDPVEHVYFPGGGFFSMVTELKDGRMVEVATIRREGMVGIAAVLDNPVSSTSMVQGEADSCYRMKADVFRREMDRRGAFAELSTHYARSSGSSCNQPHATRSTRSSNVLEESRQDSRPAYTTMSADFTSLAVGYRHAGTR